MTSSTLYYWLGRWGLIAFAFVFGGFGAYAAYRGDLPVAAVFTAGFVGLLGCAIWLHDRIAVVTLAEEGVEVRGGGSANRYAWFEIAQVRQVPRTRPPVYRMDFRDTEQAVYCVVPDHFQSIEFLDFMEVEDLSGFGDYARQQILRAGIEKEEARMAAEQQR